MEIFRHGHMRRVCILATFVVEKVIKTIVLVQGAKIFRLLASKSRCSLKKTQKTLSRERCSSEEEFSVPAVSACRENWASPRTMR